MKNKKLSWLLIILLITFVYSGLGCSIWPFAEESSWNDDSQSSGDEIAVTTMGDTNSLDEIIINQDNQSYQPLITVDLFFKDPQTEKLVCVKRNIPKVTGIARSVVEELIRGPEPGSELVATMPLGTSLLDINVRPDGQCIVDMSREFKVNLVKDYKSENLAVYSLVNTLTQFPTIKEVQIIVDGQKIKTLGGYTDLSQPLSRDEEWIKNN